MSSTEIPLEELGGGDVLAPSLFERGYPHDLWRRLRAESPLHFFPKGPVPYWAATRHRDITYVSRNPELFTSELALGVSEPAPDTLKRPKSMIEMDPPRHRVFRRMISARFTPRAVEKLRAHAADIVRGAFRFANEEVYRYAHEMGAGSKLAAQGIVSVFDGRSICIGRVGNHESFLWRRGSILQVFEPEKRSTESAGHLERFIGANAQILVDLATISVEDGDVLVVSSFNPSEQTSKDAEAMLSTSGSLDFAAKQLAIETIRKEPRRNGDGRNAVVSILKVGAGPIMLRDIVR